MTKKQKNIQFNGVSIPVIFHKNDWWLNAEDIGKALGYKDPRTTVQNIYLRHKDVFQDATCLFTTPIKDPRGYMQNREIRGFNRSGVLLIIMYSKSKRADDFRKWALSQLKESRDKELNTLRSEKKRLEEELEFLKSNTQPSSRSSLFKTVLALPGKLVDFLLNSFKGGVQ